MCKVNEFSLKLVYFIKQTLKPHKQKYWKITFWKLLGCMCKKGKNMNCIRFYFYLCK